MVRSKMKNIGKENGKVLRNRAKESEKKPNMVGIAKLQKPNNSRDKKISRWKE